MSGRHRKPTTSNVSVAKIAFTGAVLGGGGIAMAAQATAATDGEWDQVARCESGGNSDDDAIEAAWRAAMWSKPAGHGINAPDFIQPDRPMSAIGG